MATLQKIRVFPIKSLDGIEVDEASIGEDGTLWRDRAYAMFDEKGNLWNARRSAVVHLLRSKFDDTARRVTLWHKDHPDQSATFDLEDERDALNRWLTDFFQRPVELHARAGGYPDDDIATGPTIISTATLREVASWFPDLSEEDLRRRIRVNLVIEAEPAFWEDRLVADFEHVVAFSIGDAQLEGVSATGRCVVPTRDPDTGLKYDDFQKIFMKQRAATFPDDVDRTRFDHLFRLTVRTNVAKSQWGKKIRIGDEVATIGKAAPQVVRQKA